MQLKNCKRKHLSDALLKAYTAYFVGYQNIENSVPLQEQRKALKKVCNSAGKLLDALNELENSPQANKRFFKNFLELEKEDISSRVINYQILMAPEKESPNYLIKELITDLLVAADEAAFDWKRYYKNFSDIKGDLELNKIEESPEIKTVYAVFGDAKWVPIRRALLILKNFWDKHIDEPFTAGHHYKELGGYNSRTIEALELILNQVDPKISQRNIVTHMLAING